MILFNMPEVSASFGLVVQELVRRSNEEGRRVHDLEQRFEAMENRIASLEQLALERFKKMEQHTNDLEAKLRSLDESIFRLKAAVDKITKQLEKTATKVELRELERAFELMQPEMPTPKAVE